MSTVFRVVKNCNYTTLSNYHFKDRRLSWKAKGLLSTMLSLPDDWNYSIEGLACLSNDGIKATNSGLIELEKYGYLTRNQKRNQNGHFGVTEYVIYEQPLEKPESAPEESVPDTDYNYHSQPLCQNGQTAENRAFSPYVQKRKTEKRFAEKGVQLNTNILNTKELNTYSSS
ncbi:MAG: helix-turn-helix domain-containing protein, partial [Lachnospiraceae bacterium]|nr:helix-turn-helix domain-containing protein [Lachnospiraceae bacterium]